MEAQITVTLSADLLERANLLAGRTGRPVADLLAETIELSLRPLGVATTEERPIADWPDAEVLAAANTAMPAEADRRLSELLERQQAASLDNGENAERLALMQQYQDGLLRKACALREAVRRGLCGPLPS